MKKKAAISSYDPPSAAPEQAAWAAHLRYVHDDRPGFTRSGTPPHFVYHTPDGKRIEDQAVLNRIRALGIPPAYRDVWICPLENGHLQATGKDARGRKQYRYRASWRAVRDAAKYDLMVAFGEALPTIRARVNADLARKGLPRGKVLTKSSSETPAAATDLAPDEKAVLVFLKQQVQT